MPIQSRFASTGLRLSPTYECPLHDPRPVHLSQYYSDITQWEEDLIQAVLDEEDVVQVAVDEVELAPTNEDEGQADRLQAIREEYRHRLRASYAHSRRSSGSSQSSHTALAEDDDLAPPSPPFYVSDSSDPDEDEIIFMRVRRAFEPRQGPHSATSSRASSIPAADAAYDTWTQIAQNVDHSGLQHTGYETSEMPYIDPMLFYEAPPAQVGNPLVHGPVYNPDPVPANQPVTQTPQPASASPYRSTHRHTHSDPTSSMPSGTWFSEIPIQPQPVATSVYAHWWEFSNPATLFTLEEAIVERARRKRAAEGAEAYRALIADNRQMNVARRQGRRVTSGISPERRIELAAKVLDPGLFTDGFATRAIYDFNTFGQLEQQRSELWSRL